MNTELVNKFQLEDKVAVITGGVGLLGMKHAEAIAEMGGIPILLDIDVEKGKIASEKISEKYGKKCSFFDCDITDEEAIINVKNEIIKIYSGVDILINNAAIDSKVKPDEKKQLSRLENFSLKQWNLEISVGLTGTFICSKVFGCVMANSGKGVIVNIASDLGLISPDQRLYRKDGLNEDEQPVKPITYSIIKHGIIGLTKYLATYWADKGIRVNTLSPGGIFVNQPNEFTSKISKLIPLGRMADKDEYKAAIVYLCSDASSYMTGSNLIVDGGRTII